MAHFVAQGMFSFASENILMVYRKKRLGTIAVLMVISFVMLCAFTGSWLYHQYQDEKASLKTTLAGIYEKQFQYYLDKALGEQYFKGMPARAGQMVFSDTSSQDSVLLKGLPDTLSRISIRQFRNASGQAGIHKTKILIKDNSPHDTSGKRIVSSTEQFSNVHISISGDSLPDNVLSDNIDSSRIRVALINILSGIGKELFSLHADTVAFRKDLDSIMNSRYDGIRYHFTTPGKEDLVIVAQEKGKPFTLSLSAYTFFLVKRMGAPIGFCVVLIGLCGFAFLLSYASLRKQMQLTEQKNDFISNMSHELKTPLTTAQLALEAFQHFDLFAEPQKTTEYLGIAQWEMKRLDRLVTNVLNNARLEEGRISFSRESVLLPELLQQLVIQLKPVCGEEGKELLYTGTEKVLLLQGDALHLQGALYNVLDNAVKYARHTVRVTLRAEQATAYIIIADDGPGIAAEHRRKIFEKFYRIPRGNEHSVKGYGLGLHYSLYVLTAHGGSISTEDTAGGGATFIITLPLNETHR